MTEAVKVSLPFSPAELARLHEASGSLGVEAWARAVVLDLAGDLAGAELGPEAASTDPPEDIPAPLLAVGETARLPTGVSGPPTMWAPKFSQ